MAEQEQQRNIWIYVWFALSVLLNVSGMASIVDGFVIWGKFFTSFIDIYRATIREPLAYIGHLVWPYGRIPGAVFDWLVISSGLTLAGNIYHYMDDNPAKALLRDIQQMEKSNTSITRQMEKSNTSIALLMFRMVFRALEWILMPIAFLLYVAIVLLKRFMGKSRFIGEIIKKNEAELMLEKAGLEIMFGEVRGTLLNFVLLVTLFVLILFLNWQLKQHGM